jgi:hypothetical protein
VSHPFFAGENESLSMEPNFSTQSATALLAIPAVGGIVMAGIRNQWPLA